VLLAKQNAALALSVCQKAAVLAGGRVTRKGTAAQIAESPEVPLLFSAGVARMAAGRSRLLFL
jgi:ABC-type branched-subunit amino acid transport system ATPase component